MSDFIQVLTNARRLRAAAREMTLESLEEALDKLAQVCKEKRDEYEKEQAAQAEKKGKIEHYLQMMAEDGIDVSELIPGVGTEPGQVTKKRAPREPKYVYMDENGEKKTWTGQGRQPTAIRLKIESGEATLESFLITPENPLP